MSRAWVLLIFLIAACSTPPGETADPNPPAEGFRYEASDPRAIALADSVMIAMGGRRAWDQTRYLGWNFLGRRYLVWDKPGKRVRIDVAADSTTYLIDLSGPGGSVFRAGTEIMDPDLRDSLVERGKAIWINDSYWLAMPFKLKDSGVALTYLGPRSTERGNTAEVVGLSFEGVGRTPQNGYDVYIDPQSMRVVQWDYYRNRQDSLPAMSTPWQDYQTYGNILLSGDRGRLQLTDIRVWDELPESVFQSPQALSRLLPE